MKKLGILTISGDKLFQGNRANFRDITRVGKQSGWDVTVIPAESLNSLTSAMLKGYVWNRSKAAWVPKITAMPDLFYNRIPYRDMENRPVVKNAKQLLKKLNIPLFNPDFFKKDILYSTLASSETNQSYLPRTETFTLKGLSDWLEEEEDFYLKPTAGSIGEGIIRIRHLNSGYRLEIQLKGMKRAIDVSTRLKLLKLISRCTASRRYVLQRAVQLPKIGNRVYDLRTLVQKDREGTWSVTGIGARVSAENGITTHVPNGGHIEAVHTALHDSFGSDAEVVYDSVEEAAVTISKEIEQVVDGIVGEMSIDFGVDTDGHIWFFEANAKPMKFDEPEIRQLSLQRLFEFGDYIISRE